MELPASVLQMHVAFEQVDLVAWKRLVLVQPSSLAFSSTTSYAYSSFFVDFVELAYHVAFRLT